MVNVVTRENLILDWNAIIHAQSYKYLDIKVTGKGKTEDNIRSKFGQSILQVSIIKIKEINSL